MNQKFKSVIIKWNAFVGLKEQFLQIKIEESEMGRYLKTPKKPQKMGYLKWYLKSEYNSLEGKIKCYCNLRQATVIYTWLNFWWSRTKSWSWRMLETSVLQFTFALKKTKPKTFQNTLFYNKRERKWSCMKGRTIWNKSM